ncbi:PTS sugar transporter subunit IIA [Amedibacillus sp. YH-ame10]
MKYVVLVSHGQFAEGLKETLTMFLGERDDVLAIGLHVGEDVDSLAKRMGNLLEAMNTKDEVLVLGDLIGGSPLTTMLDCLEQKGLLQNAVVLGGMNLAMALNAILMKEDFTQAKEMALKEGKEAMKEMILTNEEEEDI